jgi:hypothetical protein
MYYNNRWVKMNSKSENTTGKFKRYSCKLNTNKEKEKIEGSVTGKPRPPQRPIPLTEYKRKNSSSNDSEL